MQKVIAKIYLENIRKNARAFREHSGARLCAVVKADAYGHGGEEVTSALADIADYFAVAIIEEGLAIRIAACGKPVLVFTPPRSKEEAYALAANGFIACVPDLFTARLLSRVCREYRLPLRVHLKVNTGMNRLGMNPSMLGKVCRLLRCDPFVQVEGIYSHLYQTNRESAEIQRMRFLQMQRICKGYFPAVISHLGATYGATLGEKFALDMVRVGLGLYGYTPAPVSFPLYKGMEVWAQVTASRKYAYGGVGYGNPKPLKKGERLTVCRFGYADGFLRRSDNGTEDCESNVNDLCMDVCIRKSKKRRGRRIPVLVDAEKTAKATGTIAYEVLCAATRRAERIYL